MPPTGPSLISLPNEILTMICANLSAKDLGAIRLLCKETNPTATTEFATRYFKDPFVMMSKESLEALVEICKHPVFGPQVRKVQLLSARPSARSLRPLDHNFRRAVDRKDVAMVRSFRSRDPLLVDMIADQLEFEVSPSSHRLMREAFKALERYQKPIAIAAQGLPLPYAPIGKTKIYKELGERPYKDLYDQDIVSKLGFMLKAASCTKCVMRKVKISLDALARWTHDLSLQSVQEFRREHASLLMRLEEFHLDLSYRPDGYIRYAVIEMLKSIIRLIPRSLENFTLSSNCDPYSFNRLPVDIIDTLAWYNELKKVSLHKVVLREEQLLGLLRANQASLKRLSLVEMIIVGDWDQILSWISKTMALDQFTLEQCYKGQERVLRPIVLPTEQWYFGSCKFRGKQDICRGLDLFIKVQAEERQARRTARLGRE
ncbi:hypothetical protein E4T49_05544 [Aureobasidium sp. EXF-10728]|nr:hypothetical protein E4T49_05544 [Aureobasidium sp. EXF-10728]